MSKPSSQRSWLGTILDAANERHILLPEFVDGGMGSAICRDPDSGRFVSYKRRLVPTREAANDGIEWTLWLEEDGLPNSVVTFREALVPAPDRVSAILAVLQGWLIDHWTIAMAEAAVADHPHAWVARIPRPRNLGRSTG